MTVFESTPMDVMIRPFAVLGVIEAAVTFPEPDWTRDAVERPATESNGDIAAPVTSNSTAVDPEATLPVIERFGPVIVVLVVAAAA